MNYSFEQIRLQVESHNRQGNKETIIDLLTTYLKSDLKISEKAWCWWNLVDNLALLRRCREAVTQQKAYLDWAIDSHLNSQQILEVMNDGTQALCWLQIDCIDDWINIFNTLINNTKPNLENRLARFYYLRTAARILITTAKYDLATNLIKQLKKILLEDTNWEHNSWIKLEITAVELNLLEANNDINQALQITTQVKEQIETIERLQLANSSQISTLWHNNAAPLFRTELYSEAELMFRKAIASNPQNWCSLVFLAVCLQKQDKSKEESKQLLDKAASLTNKTDYEALLSRINT
ncbi:hypothetical protein H1P_730021 [Hyella patelloides LEGE 07179]|uniref:Tetratricopeptide repeat protein n=1 Tax=Hyella patelloides LEGE 07179 TaxID=945734 RepID=A0A563W3Q4_9CYAN|nr:hypothetical protein [Hyella patelloides]VEP18280.1 hypothetical protein H1P_730021 [Hyella patelloides LEGE 07179]